MTAEKHGHASNSGSSSTYLSWEAMKARCDNPKHVKYPEYGGRGITYMPAWGSFSAFYADMGDRPPNTTLDRKDGNIGYSKENCRWADPTQQVLNRKTPKHNTTGRKGVHWHKAAKKWFSRGTAYGHVYNLYYGDSFEDAVKAREQWEGCNNVPGV